MSLTPEQEIEILDNTIMTWGRYQGQQMKDIPSSYLLWFDQQDWSNERGFTKQYVAKRRDFLLDKYQRETGKIFRPSRVVTPLVAEQPINNPVAVTPAIGNNGILTINGEDFVARNVELTVNGFPSNIIRGADFGNSNDVTTFSQIFMDEMIRETILIEREQLASKPKKKRIKKQRLNDILVADERAIEI